MLCRLVASANKLAKDMLKKSLENSKEETCNALKLLQALAEDGQEIGNYCQLAKSFHERMQNAGGFLKIYDQCNALLESHGYEHRGYISQHLNRNRSLLFKIIDALNLQSATQECNLKDAINCLIKHKDRRSEYLDLSDEVPDLSFTTDYWRNRIIKIQKNGKLRYNRKELETCIFQHADRGLRSGDLYTEGSTDYSDYRSEFMPWEACEPLLDGLCESSNIPNNPADLIAGLKQMLIDKAKKVDELYPEQNAFVINPEDGKPVLKKYEAKLQSEKSKQIEQLIKQRMSEKSLFDVLISTHKYAEWADVFGPITGTEEKIKNPIPKYIIASFCYATGMGPTQTAKHVRYNITPRMISRINRKHVSIKNLEEALTKVINCLNSFPLLLAWGTGERCGVDGTFEDIHDNNLIAEQHIRYGKKGGVAYRHISDNYIALFSTFIQSGTWEAIHIIDGLLKNASEVQPKIVHGDTQGQSLTVFAFAYLLGIKLMPRIRSWKDVNLYKADKSITYQHIDDLFCDSEINWKLIETHWQDLMQVIISIKEGKISSRLILSKLNSYNHQNKLYKAFRELGKVIRTAFLLDYISDMELRQMITSTTNKVESYHTLEDWIRFGSNKLTLSNNVDDMEKSLKFCDLVANCIMLHNVIEMSQICYNLNNEGYDITAEDLSYLSPYMTEHIKRFGEYVLILNKAVANIDEIRDRAIFK